MKGQETAGQLIAQARKAMRLSRPAVAVEMSKALGLVIDQSYVARVENGKIARADKERLVWLAGHLGIDEGKLLRAADYNDVDVPQRSYAVVPAVAKELAQLPDDIQLMVLDYVPTLRKVAELMGYTATEPEPSPATPMSPEDLMDPLDRELWMAWKSSSLQESEKRELAAELQQKLASTTEMRRQGHAAVRVPRERTALG